MHDLSFLNVDYAAMHVSDFTRCLKDVMDGHGNYAVDVGKLSSRRTRSGPGVPSVKLGLQLPYGTMTLYRWRTGRRFAICAQHSYSMLTLRGLSPEGRPAADDCARMLLKISLPTKAILMRRRQAGARCCLAVGL